MRILIIGAGFIGYNLSEGFMESSYDVSIVDKVKPEPVANYRFFQRDAEGNIEDIFNQVKPDAVYYTIRDDKAKQTGLYVGKIASLNLFLNVLNNCIKYHVKKIIVCSNLGISHNDCESCINTKRYKLPTLSPADIQMFTKELYLQNLKKEYGIEFVSLRLPDLYGHKKELHWSSNVIDTLIGNALKNKSIKVSQHADDFINLLYIGDAISALIYALRENVTGIFNVIGETYSMIQIVDEIKKHIPIKIKYTNEIVEDYHQPYLLTALNNYGWQPIVTLQTGVKVTLRHMKNL